LKFKKKKTVAAVDTAYLAIYFSLLVIITFYVTYINRL